MKSRISFDVDNSQVETFRTLLRGAGVHTVTVKDLIIATTSQRVAAPPVVPSLPASGRIVGMGGFETVRKSSNQLSARKHGMLTQFINEILQSANKHVSTKLMLQTVNRMARDHGVKRWSEKAVYNALNRMGDKLSKVYFGKEVAWQISNRQLVHQN